MLAQLVLLLRLLAGWRTRCCLLAAVAAVAATAGAVYIASVVAAFAPLDVP